MAVIQSYRSQQRSTPRPGAGRSLQRIDQVGAPQITAVPSPAAMGAGFGQTLAAVGQNLLSQELQIRQEERVKANEIRVTAADTNFLGRITTYQHDPKTGVFITDVGSAAVDLTSRAKEFFDKTYGEIYDGLANDQQKEVFAREAQRHWNNFTMDVQTHEAKEFKLYEAETTEGKIKLNSATAVLHAGDMNRVQESVLVIDKTIEEFGTRNKKPPEWIANEKAKQHSDVYVGVIDRLLATPGNDMRAKIYFEMKGNEITGPDHDRLTAKIEVATLEGHATRLANEAFAKFGPKSDRDVASVDVMINALRGKKTVDPASEVTGLTGDEENAFQAWAAVNHIPDVDAPGSHYDYRGYWKEHGDAPIEFGVDHFTDTYKQHGHPTFSEESKYSSGAGDGGTWSGPDGETFTPGSGGGGLDETDAKLFKAAQDVIISRTNLWNAGVKARGDKQESTVWQAVLAGATIDRLPSIPGYLDLDGRTQVAIRDYLVDESYQAGQRTDAAESRLFTKQQRARTLREQGKEDRDDAAFGDYLRLTKPENLIQLNEDEIINMLPSLGKSRTADLLNDRRALDKPGAMIEATINEDLFETAAESAGLNPYLTPAARAKIDPQGTARLGFLKNRVLKIIGERERGGVKLSRKDKEDIIHFEIDSKVMLQNEQRVPRAALLPGDVLAGGAIYSPNARPLTVADVPVPMRDEIRKTLTDRGEPLTDENILFIYDAMKRRKK